MDTRTKSEEGDGEALSASPEGEGADRSGQRIAHFVLGEKLGLGGMGVVYAAEDRKLRRRVALKLLPAEVAASPARRRRFLREARSASAFVHPNVAAVFEIGEDGDDLFLAMELVEGRTLRALLRERGGPLPVAEALSIARDIARGAARAHRAGVVHRDLKPENVMIGPDGGVKILDFGVARLLRADDDAPAHAPTASEPATLEGRILGTPGYMAPEQAHGRPVDARADVFSFGVLLHEMLAGARPFGGEGAIERLLAAARDAPAPLRARNPAVPEALDALVTRCLEKRAEDRPASCVEVAEALDALDADGAAPARIAPRRRLHTIIAAAAAAMIAGGALAAWQTRRAPVVPPAPTTSTLATPAKITPRRLCADERADGCTVADGRAWCDVSGKPIACCGRGLVPVGADGICGCPPGGTLVAEVIARGCPRPPPDLADAGARAKQELVARVIACFEPLVDAGRIDGGRFSGEYVLSPEGEVVSARVKSSTMPNEDAQACAVAAMRGARFPPPPGEEAGAPKTFGFEFESRDEQERKRR
jgi:predicted Ser/Thr protein kinase